MTDSSTLFVLRHKSTGKFRLRTKSFLLGNQKWIATTKPTVDAVREQLRLAEEREPRWTTDINEADVWDDYDITRWAQYFRDEEFVSIRLSGKPLGDNMPWQQTVVSLASEPSA